LTLNNRVFVKVLQAHVETKDSIAEPVVTYALMHFEVVDAL
jgi:hypothetical protein